VPKEETFAELEEAFALDVVPEKYCALEQRLAAAEHAETLIAAIEDRTTPSSGDRGSAGERVPLRSTGRAHGDGWTRRRVTTCP